MADLSRMKNGLAKIFKKIFKMLKSLSSTFWNALAWVIIGLIILVLMVFSVSSYQKGEWILFFGLVVFTLALFNLIIFRVRDVFMALPSSVFTGRIKRFTDENDCSIPIRKPYKEGFHLKLPWWTVTFFSRKVKQLSINAQEYQIGSGGTVLISGLIQYRVSAVAAYRAAEIGEAEIKAGLSSEIDQIIIKRLGKIGTSGNESDITDDEVVVNTGIDEAIQTRGELERELLIKLNNKIVVIDSEKSQGEEIIGFGRNLFGKDITYAEHAYGVEIFNAKIAKIDPTDDIKTERDAIQKERYQTRSQKIELQHLRNRAKEVKADFPELTHKESMEVVQIALGQVDKNINEFQLKNLTKLSGIVSDILKKR